MSVKRKVTFTVKIPVDPDDDNNKETKEIQLEARTPTIAEVNQAQMAYNRGLDAALSSKAPLRIEVDRLLEKRNIWTDVSREEFKRVKTELDHLVNKLQRGRIKLKEARELALDIRDKRVELANLTAPRRILDLSTAEAQAEGARFNWFVAHCVVYPEVGTPFFKDEEDYLEKGDTEYAQECARQFSMLQYGLEPDAEKKFPENAFLLKYGFVRDKDLKLVDRDNNLIDREGNFVDEEGFILDKPGGNRVNYAGTPINKDNVPEVESSPFFDDEGNPV